MLASQVQVECGLFAIGAATIREWANDAAIKLSVWPTLMFDPVVVGVALFRLLLKIVKTFMVLLFDLHDFC